MKFNEPLALRSGVVLRNRLVMAPMTIVSSFHDGTVTKEEIQHYAMRSKGLGAVITGTANVTDNGKGWPGELTIATDEAIGALTQLSKGVHQSGTKAILQIFHAGRMTSQKTIGEQPVSASAFAAESPNAEQPRELDNFEIEEIIEAFGQATRRAIAAGFDGVEIHGANTYLLQQFFSPHSNRRTDEWGGSLENRAKFPLAVIDRVLREVKEIADRPFAVGYRLSPVEITEPGIRFEDTLWFLETLKEKELDYLHISLKHFGRKSNDENYQDKSELAYIHDALEGRIPLIGVGGVRNLEDVEGLLENAELAAIGQQLLIDPEFAVKLIEKRTDEIISKPFGEPIQNLPMPHPMFKYLEKRYQ